MLYHIRRNFPGVVIPMEKTTPAISNIYQTHLHVSRQLTFVAQMSISDLLATLGHFDC